MSFGYLIEIFGGTGAVVIGIGTCIWGFFKKCEVKYDYDEEDKQDPVDVLNEEWETPGENFSIEEHFGSNWARLKFAKKEKLFCPVLASQELLLKKFLLHWHQLVLHLFFYLQVTLHMVILEVFQNKMF